MPNIKLQWKGYPHHRLPRIRVASTPRNSVRTRSQLAAEQVLGSPLGNAIEHERKKHRFNWRLRRGRGRSSRSACTLAVVRSRRHAIQRARQHIQIFGWGASQAELADRRTLEAASVIKPQAARRVDTASGAQNQDPRSDSAIPSTDGAASSSVRRVKTYPKDPGKLYSLMHVAEVPVYWKSRNTDMRKRSASGRSSTNTTRRLGAEYAQLGPLKTVNRRNTFRGSQPLERRRIYDCRTDPKQRPENQNKSGTANVGASSGGAQDIDQKKEIHFSTELREAIKSLDLQTEAEADTPSDANIAPSSRETIISDTASRTPSQRKALRKFTREIELYLQACRSLPKGTLAATPSSISARTIEEFTPYQAEFQSAGLAITSKQQLRLSEVEVEQSPPPTPPKDEKWSRAKPEAFSDDIMVLRKEKQKEKHREPSYASASTGTTVLGWTPPHEKSSPPTKIARLRSPESGTIIRFTPPHEMAVPPARPPPPAPQTRKSLPWLRKPEASHEPISPTKGMSTVPDLNKSQPPIPLEGQASTSDSTAKDSAMEKIRKSDPVFPPRPISKRSTNIVDQPAITTLQAEKSTQHDVDVVDTTVITKYADVSTQTNVNAEGSQPNREEIAAKNDEDEGEMKRSPIITGRQTFPMVKNKCKDDCRACSDPVIGPLPPKSWKQLRVRWEGIDQSIQTDDIDPIVAQPEEQKSPEISAPSREGNVMHDPERSSRPQLCHTCTSRPSLICQQCFPSRRESASISPVSNCPWRVPDDERGRLTEDMIPSGSAGCSRESVEPPIIDQTAQGASGSDELPKKRSMPMKIVGEIDVVYSDRPSRPDTMKRSSLPRLKLKQPTVFQASDQRALYNTATLSRALLERHTAPVAVSPTDVASKSSLDTLGLKPGQITDKQVFKGLHVATAAACDEDVDKWIEEITGCGVRKFLADLSCFEGLGVNTLAGVAKRAARQRKERVRAWEIVREARVAQKKADAFSGSGEKVEKTCPEAGEKIDWVVGEMGVVASDGVEEGLACKTVHGRDCRRGEGRNKDRPAGC